jgi:bifunctional non-homologous end joining protein LigD
VPGGNDVAEELPNFIEPMLARLGLPDAAEGGAWTVELKWDGMRGQLGVAERGRWWLRSRRGRECREFPELAAVAALLDRRRLLLDGELVCLAADGKPDFAALRRRLVITGEAAIARAAAIAPATFIAFDLLHLDGRSTRGLPYRTRRELLNEVAADGPFVRVRRPFGGELGHVLAVTRAAQLEGVVCKRLDARYEPGRRSGAWLKHKHRRRETFAVSGWTPARPGRREPDTVYVDRVGPDGTGRRAGSVQLGLAGDARAALRAELHARELRAPARRRFRHVAAGIGVEIDFHGAPDRPLRDPVIRAVLVDGKRS